MKASIVFYITLLLTFSPWVLLMAQPSSPAPVPIDGGASILAAAGVAYGVKKYRDYQKSQKQE